MSQFYFNFRSGDVLAEDDVGLDLGSLEDVAAKALSTARELLADNLKGRLPLFDELIVTDEAGKEVFRLSAKDALPAPLK